MPYIKSQGIPIGAKYYHANRQQDSKKSDEIPEIKYYVNFIKNGQKSCNCFESDEQQARHFASLVNGEVIREGRMDTL